jgi:hypothetical protein
MANTNSRKKMKENKKRNGKRASPVVGLTRTPLIFPSLFRGIQSYEGLVGISPAAGSAVANVWRWNSVYDPDFTGAGTTACGYNQLSALYGRYRVLGAKCTCTFVNTSNTTPLTVFMVVNPVTTVGVNITAILQQRYVWSRAIGTYTGSAAVTHTVAGPVGRFYGVPEHQVRDEDDFAAVAGGNPNNGVYIHIGAYANGGSAGAVNLHVRIEYDVVWSLPLELS